MKHRCKSAGIALAVFMTACGTSTGTDPNAVAYPYQFPASWPAPVIPTTDPMSAPKAQLGRHLFYDRRLSGNQTESCADCHQQSYAFTIPFAVPYGSHGERVRRNPPSLTNVAYDSTLTWANPNLRTLEQQVLVPLFTQNPTELGVADRESAVFARFAADPAYAALFTAAFPGDPTPVSEGNVVEALASFLRTMISNDSAYDRALRGDATAMSASALRGEYFFNHERGECYHCHGANFAMTDSYTRAGSDIAPVVFHNTGLYNLGGTGAYPTSDQGVFEITGQASDMGRFRSPTLRNIALTAPYMHDGSIGTLTAVVEMYAHGGQVIATGPTAGDGSMNPYRDPLIRGFTFMPGEEDDLIAFLNALTDWSFVSDPRLSNPFLPGARPIVCADPGMPACSATPLSYAADVAPIIVQRCSLCHNADAPGAPWDVTSYVGLSSNAAQVALQLRGCTMPPSEAPAITSAEQLKVLTWIACSTPDN